MGFDRQRTVHRFLLFTDGGAIEVGVKDLSDDRRRDAIRAHLSLIARTFGEGNLRSRSHRTGAATPPVLVALV